MFQALASLDSRLSEVRALQTRNPVPPGTLPVGREEGLAAAAINKAAVLLVCAGLEAFVEELLLEGVDRLTNAGVDSGRIPVRLKHLHAHRAVRDLAATTDPTKFSSSLRTLIEDNVLLAFARRLTPDAVRPELLKAGFAMPTPENIASALAPLGITKYQVVTGCFASRHTAGAIVRTIRSLIDVRTEIAHEGSAAPVTPQDVSRYATSVRIFAGRLDLLVGQQVRLIIDGPGSETPQGYRFRSLNQ